MRKNYLIIVIVLILIIAAAAYWFWPKSLPKTYMESDQTFTDDYVVPANTILVAKNGIKLTFEKNLTISGDLFCENGPLNLVVKGKLQIDHYVQCNLAGDNNNETVNSIMIVASEIEVAKDAMVIANGNVQIVKNEADLALNNETIDQLYEQAGTYTGGKKNIGPFIPFDLIPDNVPGKPTTQNIITPQKTAKQAENSNFSLIKAALAADPATDIEGSLVKNTVKIGGTWIIGANPNKPLPRELTMPTPPPGIKRIILNFNYGGDNIIINDFNLTGPDGREGKAGEKNCDSKGAQGENAMRFNVIATGITINNFDIHLGSGGKGGKAETSNDCDSGLATGGNGGEAGNMRMIADDSISIEGALNIYPGMSGRGGDANAYGKKGEDGCPGTPGGKAIAKGGLGGNNTKGMLVSREVGGTENIVLHEIYAGEGGNALARGGMGGNGIKEKCNGGNGGNAEAYGGKGGDAKSVKAKSSGGNGGSADSAAGDGGKGGTGSVSEAGGNGGNGGNATAVEGNNGLGTTENGIKGIKLTEQAGSGGNGGDGCLPGNGEKAGTGSLPAGADGQQGKNLCEDTTKTPATPQEDQVEYVISGPLSFTHNIGSTSCPQNIGTITISSTNIPEGTYLKITKSFLPAWLGYTSGDTKLSANLKFTCQLQKYETQTLNTDVEASAVDSSGNVLKTFKVNVIGNINK